MFSSLRGPGYQTGGWERMRGCPVAGGSVRVRSHRHQPPFGPFPRRAGGQGLTWIRSCCRGCRLQAPAGSRTVSVSGGHGLCTRTLSPSCTWSRAHSHAPSCGESPARPGEAESVGQVAPTHPAASQLLFIPLCPIWGFASSTWTLCPGGHQSPTPGSARLERG